MINFLHRRCSRIKESTKKIELDISSQSSIRISNRINNKFYLCEHELFYVCTSVIY